MTGCLVLVVPVCGLQTLLTKKRSNRRIAVDQFLTTDATVVAAPAFGPAIRSATSAMPNQLTIAATFNAGTSAHSNVRLLRSHIADRKHSPP